MQKTKTKKKKKNNNNFFDPLPLLLLRNIVPWAVR
jgi:hypothetical protein